MQEMAVTESRKRGLLRYSKNPFWEETQIEIGQKRIALAGGRLVTPEGESVDHGGVHITRRIDREEFVKLYTREMRVLFELRPTAMKVIQYLLVEIQKNPNTDGLYLHWLTANKYFSENDMKVGRSAFHNALRDLLEKKILAESDSPNLFWINPRFFWNGDRYKFVREYVIGD